MWFWINETFYYHSPFQSRQVKFWNISCTYFMNTFEINLTRNIFKWNATLKFNSLICTYYESSVVTKHYFVPLGMILTAGSVASGVWKVPNIYSTAHTYNSVNNQTRFSRWRKCRRAPADDEQVLLTLAEIQTPI